MLPGLSGSCLGEKRVSIEDEEQLRRRQNRGFFQKDAVFVGRKQLVESNEMLQRTNALTLAISA